MPDAMEKQQNLEQATQCLKALAHPIRLGILCALTTGEKNVQQLEAQLGASQSNISQHLSTMRNRMILTCRREGNQVFYQARDPRMFQLIEVLQAIYCKTDDHP